MEYYAFLKRDAFYEVCFFLIFCYDINSKASFYALSVCKTVYENAEHDVFELLSKLNVYVQGVRLIPVGFQTKLNTFFDIAVVWKRKRGN